MKPERWQQLDKLFHSALEREPAARAAFLNAACAGDESLRKHVEILLGAHEEAGSFIERPAMEVEAQGLAADETLETGLAKDELVSHYRIVDPLGVGGMGQVYLAQDMALGRKVALKLLPADFTRDKDRVRRFQQEARAASALNHPNIITIYEIGQVDDRHFIATEFIDGQTVRERITRSQSRMADEGSRTSGTALQLHEVLSIAFQTADALAAAHEAGIVHRDIKPENIMVRWRDGYVKVLDFGLAKLTEVPAVTVDTEGSTRTLFQTSAGMVMGTVNYMSPEQARGERVDSRTDIWSLGVVLYEMVAGCAPFERSTPSEIIALILEREPAPLTRFAQGVPSELERIVSKALTKDREERYQTAKDLLIDLRRLRQRLEVEAEIERFVTPGSASEGTVTTDSAPASVATADEAMARTDETTARPTSSAEFLVSEIKQHKRGAVVALAIVLLAVVGIAISLRGFLSPQKTKAMPFQAIKISKIHGLTSAGLFAFRPAISPDGKYVAYVPGGRGQQSLWIRQVATTSNVQLVPLAEVAYRGETFSPDANYLYYVVVGKDDPQGALYQIPVLGGAPRKLLTNIQSPVTFSPDGKRLAFYRRNPDQREDLLMVANSDGTGEQKLASRKGVDWFNYGGPPAPGPAWSPDGTVIACGAGKDDRGLVPVTVVAVRVEDGTQREITSQRWTDIGRLTWLGDGSGLLLPASEQSSSSASQSASQVWYLSYPGGEARKITDDFHSYQDFSLTTDSGTLIAFQFDLATNIWIAPNGDAKLANRITSSNDAGGGGLSWTPDGKIVYQSLASGNEDIWIMDADGSNQKQLTVNAGASFNPIVTADGRYIVFVNGANIWRMDIDGSNPKQLTHGNDDLDPHCSPDSKWIVYTSSLYGKPTLWKVAIDGGDPVQLTNKSSELPAVSPDGKWIACLYWNEQSDTPKRVAIIPFEGGEPIKQFDWSQGWRFIIHSIRWTPDGRAITYPAKHSGVANIWSQPIDGGAAKWLTDFKDSDVSWYDWSHDGRQLACARGAMVNSIVLISDSK